MNAISKCIYLFCYIIVLFMFMLFLVINRMVPVVTIRKMSNLKVKFSYLLQVRMRLYYKYHLQKQTLKGNLKHLYILVEVL